MARPIDLQKALIGAAATVALLGAVYWYLHRTGGIDLLHGGQAFRDWVQALGWFGPIAVVGALALAIVFSPIPSAPIALAAGAAYGHGWGTFYVLLGSECGAIIAFFIGRMLGYDLLRHWLGKRLDAGLLGSQRAMMVTVFLSRLLPFISFDVVSYAAGLTHLRFWRFAIATMAGILPASFVLAHFGGEFATGELPKIATTVLLLGAVTLLPLAVAFVRRSRRGNS